MGALAELVVNANVDLIVMLLSATAARKVIPLPNGYLEIGARYHRQQGQRLRREILRGNEIVGKSRRSRETRIVYLPLRGAEKREVIAKVAPARSGRNIGRSTGTLNECGWHRLACGGPQNLPGALIIDEEECLVLHDRSPEGTAELVVLRGGDKTACDRVWRRLRERISGLSGIGLPILEQVAMEAVRAGLGLSRNYRSHGLTELGVIVLRRNLGFGDCIERRIDNDLTKDGILIRRSVQFVSNS